MVMMMMMMMMMTTNLRGERSLQRGSTRDHRAVSRPGRGQEASRPRRRAQRAWEHLSRADPSILRREVGWPWLVATVDFEVAKGDRKAVAEDGDGDGDADGDYEEYELLNEQ